MTAVDGLKSRERTLIYILLHQSADPYTIPWRRAKPVFYVTNIAADIGGSAEQIKEIRTGGYNCQAEVLQRPEHSQGAKKSGCNEERRIPIQSQKANSGIRKPRSEEIPAEKGRKCKRERRGEGKNEPEPN